MASEQPAVRPGQVWADNDPRAKGRTIRVDYTITVVERGTSVEYAECTVLTDHHGLPARSSVGRKCKIRVSRFRPTANGYRLLESPPLNE